MKGILSFLIFFTFLGASSVDTKIKSNKKQLTAKKVEYKKMDRELSIIAKKILTAKKEQKKLNNKLGLLEKNIKNNEKKYSNLKKKNQVLSTNLSKVSASTANKQEKFVALVSKKFSMALALEELKQPTRESVMMQEVYEVYAQKNNLAIEALKKEIKILEDKKSKLTIKALGVQLSIDKYTNERIEYQEKKNKKVEIIAELARDKEIYKKRFNKIKASRRSLEKKLARLRIIKEDEESVIRAKKLEEENRIALAQAVRENRSMVASNPIAGVTMTQVSNYNGGKTISPLKGSRLIKKFGSYIDPIYKFKIFNKSITLKAPHVGSKVRSVLKGKIVFAENSGGMLGKVVIMEHANGIHTIYAKLSRLAPGVHVGKQLSIGATIGKVDKSLMFEVTKNNKHMNPLKLIRL
jgi:septal ring factor EnvC (AmiA/AmiB activator)